MLELARVGVGDEGVVVVLAVVALPLDALEAAGALVRGFGGSPAEDVALVPPFHRLILADALFFLGPAYSRRPRLPSVGKLGTIWVIWKVKPAVVPGSMNWTL